MYNIKMERSKFCRIIFLVPTQTPQYVIVTLRSVSLGFRIQNNPTLETSEIQGLAYMSRMGWKNGTTSMPISVHHYNVDKDLLWSGISDLRAQKDPKR